jgi:hypothetical protein
VRNKRSRDAEAATMNVRFRAFPAVQVSASTFANRFLAVRAEHVAPQDVLNQPIGHRRIAQATGAVGGLQPLAHELGNDVAATERALSATEMAFPVSWPIRANGGCFAHPDTVPQWQRQKVRPVVSTFDGSPGVHEDPSR